MQSIQRVSLEEQVNQVKSFLSNSEKPRGGDELPEEQKESVIETVPLGEAGLEKKRQLSREEGS